MGSAVLSRTLGPAGAGVRSGPQALGGPGLWEGHFPNLEERIEGPSGRRRRDQRKFSPGPLRPEMG